LIGGAGVRAKRISLFFVTVVCFFGISNDVFARIEMNLAKSDNSVTVLGDGEIRMVRQDALAGNSRIHDMVSGLSRGHAVSGKNNTPFDHSSEISRILSVIERRVGDKTLLKKIAAKLPALSDDRLQMIASLSERIAAEDHGAKTDIAFLLLTTLIIFS